MSVLEYLFRKYHSRQKLTTNELEVLSYLSRFKRNEFADLCHKHWDTILINSI